MSLNYQLIKTEIKKLPRNLCSKAKATDLGKKFSLLILKKLSGYKGQKLLKFFTEGSGDHQIDGVYQEESDDLQISIITCKFASKALDCFADKDVTDFLQNGISFLILGEKKPSDINDKVLQVKEELDENREEFEQKCRVVVKFISVGESVLTTNSRNYVNGYQADLQSKGINFEFEEINGNKLATIFSSRSALKTTMPVKLSGKSYYPVVGREGFICRLPASELIKMYHGFTNQEGRSYSGYKDYIFEDNVRKNLGLKKQINKKIYQTATDNTKSADFEHFNNGLTIIYDDKTGNLAQDSPVLYLKGIQVVNGCQTVSTLMKAQEDGVLCDDIYLLCRFLKRSNDTQFMQSVITYTNSQNAISDRDLHSNEDIQYTIQSILKNIGIYYERKLNEFAEDIADDKRLDALDAAHAYICCALMEPHKAKQKRKKIFSEYYSDLFKLSDPALPYKLYISYLTMDFALLKQSENRIRKNIIKKGGKKPRYTLKDRIISHGSYHIASFLYNDLFSGLDTDNLEKIARNFSFEEKFNERYKFHLQNMVKILKDKKADKADLPALFKKEGIDYFTS